MIVQEVPLSRLQDEEEALKGVRCWEGKVQQAFREGALATLAWLQHQGPAPSVKVKEASPWP